MALPFLKNQGRRGKLNHYDAMAKGAAFSGTQPAGTAPFWPLAGGPDLQSYHPSRRLRKARGARTTQFPAMPSPVRPLLHVPRPDLVAAQVPSMAPNGTWKARARSLVWG